MSRPFLPTTRQMSWLIAIGLLSLGYALYLRYLVVESVPVAPACDSGVQTWLCLTRRATLILDEKAVFGWVAIVAAALTFIRPNIVAFAIALGATGFGLALHNAGLAGFAAGLIVLSLARPAGVPE